ncbi:MAG: hypothetical protein U1F06_00800 [Steroidobacteraceae bacterium]
MPTCCSATSTPTTSSAARCSLTSPAARRGIEREIAGPLGIPYLQAVQKASTT